MTATFRVFELAAAVAILRTGAAADAVADDAFGAQTRTARGNSDAASRTAMARATAAAARRGTDILRCRSADEWRHSATMERASSAAATSTSALERGAGKTTNASFTSLMPALDILRVSQVDAGRLDAELVETLGAQLSRVVHAYDVLDDAPHGVWNMTAEMRLALDVGLFACTTGINRPTPGQDLMNLRLRDERAWRAATARGDVAVKTGVEGEGLSVATRLAYGVVRCAGRYAWGKWQEKMLRERFDEDEGDSWKYRAWRLSQTAENAHAVASFVNFCVFLRHGSYPTLLDRALGARLVYQRPSMARVVDFEYLNQQLAWRELSELVLFTLPYLYSTRLRSLFGALTRPMSSSSSSSSASTQPRGGVTVQAYECVACGCREPVHPFVAEPCGHPYCYYCLRARMVDRTTCPCVKCSQPVQDMRRLVTTAKR